MTGVKASGGEMQMVDNSHMLDPVLTKLFKSAGLDANSLGVEAIEEAKNFAESKGLYEHYELKKQEKARRPTTKRPNQVI